MLSRIASELYWLSRYLERAENTARMLDVAWNLSLIPKVTTPKDELAAPMKITGCIDLFDEKHSEHTVNDILQFMTLDAANPSSICYCMNQARDKAKAVRGKITNEMWEAINATWIELNNWKKKSPKGSMSASQITDFIDWVKSASNLFRGTAFGTLVRNDAYCFLRLGTFIERADNTARILIVKHQNKQQGDNSEMEHYRLNALLRSVGAWETYRELYRESVEERDVAEMLILRDEFPRSLLSCMQEIFDLLAGISGDQGLNTKRLAGVQLARIRYGDIKHILDIGTHQYIDDFIYRVNELGQSITQEYLEVV